MAILCGVSSNTKIGSSEQTDFRQLGEDLKELRLIHRMGLRQFAQVLGVTPSRLSAVERGRIDRDGEMKSLTDDELVGKLPVFVKTADGRPLSDDEIELLVETVRNA